MRRRRCVPLEPGGDAERVDTARERSERRRGRVTRGTRGGGGGARRYPAKVAKARARPRDGGDRGRRVGGDGERACAGRLQEGVQSPERSHTHRSLSAATRNRLWIILGRARSLEKKAVTKYGFLAHATTPARAMAEASQKRRPWRPVGSTKPLELMPCMRRRANPPPGETRDGDAGSDDDEEVGSAPVDREKDQPPAGMPTGQPSTLAGALARGHAIRGRRHRG